MNAWLAIPSGFSAEVMAQRGWDTVTVDIRHAVQDYRSMVPCFQAMQAHEEFPALAPKGPVTTRPLLYARRSSPAEREACRKWSTSPRSVVAC